MRRVRFTAVAIGATIAVGMAMVTPASAATSTTGSAAPAGNYLYHTPGFHVIRTERVKAGPAIGEIKPAISEESCTSSRATWVHIDDYLGYDCFGGMGYESYNAAPRLYTFCAGNNNGVLDIVVSGIKYFGTYSAGFAQDYGCCVYVFHFSIAGWSGGDTC